MSHANSINGVLAPVVTPFQANLKIDKQRLILHCRWLLSHDCNLAIFGTNSEANSLSLDERLELLDFLVENGLNSERIMPGTGCCSILDSATLTKKAIALGCNNVLMLPPFYYKEINDEGLFRNFAEIIERVGDSNLKIFLYNFPQMSALSFGIDLVARLVKHFPNTIVGMKDSSGDLSYAKAILRNFPNFRLFVGSETSLLTALQHGGVGCISATANINPKKIVNLFHKWQSNEAAVLQRDISKIRKLIED